jgi:arginase
MRAATTITNRIPIATIAVSCGAGALYHGCEDGPAAFRRYLDRHTAPLEGAQVAWQLMPKDPERGDETTIELIARTSRWLAESTRRLAQNGNFFVAIGGDHSYAIGTWNGASEGLQEPLGLIWIDAHMDMHVPETTPSGAINGMPLAALLGYGLPQLTALSRGTIPPDRICLIGTRSCELEEVAFAARHGIRVIGMDEISRRGIEEVCAEARTIADSGAAGYGVSLDLDAFDPADAPGVGTPEAGGIRASDFLPAWADLTSSARCVGIEIVEYNPHRDRADRTARLMSGLVAAAVGEETMQWAL